MTTLKVSGAAAPGATTPTCDEAPAAASGEGFKDEGTSSEDCATGKGDDNPLDDVFSWSVGRSRYDAHPVNQQGSLRDFAFVAARSQAVVKAHAGYVAAAFSDGHRCRVSAQPRRWTALDIDFIDGPDVLVSWRLYAARWRGFGWPTASSSQEAPRERVIVALSRPVTRDEGVQIGALIKQDAADEFGSDVRIDHCTFRGEQPCFLPLRGTRLFYLLGDDIDADVWLENAPPPPPPPPPLSDRQLAATEAGLSVLEQRLYAHGLVRHEMANERGLALYCPWADGHSTTDEPGSTATVLLRQTAESFWRPRFNCFHTHCKGRVLAHLEMLIDELDARQQRHQQQGAVE